MRPQVAVGMEGEDCRVFHCDRCGTEVRICRRCDRGNVYCAKGCAAEGRRKSLRCAGKKNQNTERGRSLHAARQQRYLERKMTHQGSDNKEAAANCEAMTTDQEESGDVEVQDEEPVAVCCDFCGRRCGCCSRRGWLLAPMRSQRRGARHFYS